MLSPTTATHCELITTRFCQNFVKSGRPSQLEHSQHKSGLSHSSDLLQESPALVLINYSHPVDVGAADNKLEQIVTSRLTDDQTSFLSCFSAHIPVN